MWGLRQYLVVLDSSIPTTAPASRLIPTLCRAVVLLSTHPNCKPRPPSSLGSSSCFPPSHSLPGFPWLRTL